MHLEDVYAAYAVTVKSSENIFI